MDTKLEELIKSRKELIEVFSKSALSEGVDALFEDLYPDNAHFIYELLQNAEDMNAAVVRFTLTKNGIRFEHNGSRRSFDLNDIDAITNIRQFKQKKEDTVSSGKFGVGFKAVYAYTSTPEVHSGGYHFRIKDFCVPEFEGVEHAETIDREGVSWTVFYLPFNNPKKPAETAFKELLDDLRSLDDTTILFLQNIIRIEYQICSENKCFITRNSENEHIIETSFSDSEDPEKIHSSKWLYFSRQIFTDDEPDIKKSLPVAVAFALEHDEDNNRDIIVPVRYQGRTFIYFPAEKEDSGFKFYINAPFASTAARNSIIDCEENSMLIQMISDLLYESLLVIRDMGLIDNNFLKVMPLKSDIKNLNFISVYSKIILAFITYELYPTGNGQYKTTDELITGPSDIFGLIDHEDIFRLTGHHKYWIPVSSDPQVRLFTESFKVSEFTENDFWSIFPEKASLLIGTKSIDWMKNFYCLCSRLYTKDRYNFSFSFNTPILTNLKMSDIILSDTNEFHKPQELYLGNPESYTSGSRNMLVNRDIADTEDIRYNEITVFFRDILGMRDFGQNIVIEKKLKKYVNKQVIKPQDLNKDYFDDILDIAEYHKINPIIRLSEYRLFIHQDNDMLVFDRPDSLCLGKNFGYSDGQVLSDSLNIPVLWNGYFEYCNDEQIEKIINFALNCGVRKGLEIVNSNAEDNPLFSTFLKCSEDKAVSYTDYDIPDLEKLLEMNDPEISLIIWNTLRNCFRKEYASAVSSVDDSSEIKTCDSRFIYILKHTKWIPDNTGQLCMPYEISEKDLDSRFEYSFIFPLLKALHLNDKTEIEQEEIRILKEKAQKLGYRLITEEEGRLFDKLTEELTKK